MKKLEDYYTNSAIIKMLCKHRVGISHKRHKKHMYRDISLHNRTNKIIISNKDVDFKTIQSLFLTRRNWKKLNQNERLAPNKLTNSLDKNEMRLWKSYKLEKFLVDLLKEALREKNDLYKALREIGVNGFGVYENFIHIDVRDAKIGGGYYYWNKESLEKKNSSITYKVVLGTVGVVLSLIGIFLKVKDWRR